MTVDIRPARQRQNPLSVSTAPNTRQWEAR